jgi:hypothetical protein
MLVVVLVLESGSPQVARGTTAQRGFWLRGIKICPTPLFFIETTALRGSLASPELFG